jgi:CubicO group peptidase (beta-lactamase class C family)
LAAQADTVGLDAYIDDVRQAWDVVGLAVAVVKDGDVVYARGFGQRELGDPAPVDAHTLFAIGSNTKAFTAAGLGLLVEEEEEFDWDDPVIDHLVWFRLYDPWVTRHITVRDLLSHRSGLGRRGDLNWYGSGFGRDEVLRRIRFLEPNTSFRSEFGYQNTMFLAAGEVTEAVTGATWDDWVTDRLLGPLGMDRTNTSAGGYATATNTATPHIKVEQGVQPVGLRNLDNVAAAGSINSSVTDMSRWMMALIDGGELYGEQVLPRAVVDAMMTPVTLMRIDTVTARLFPSTHFSTYGLGLVLRDYGGRLLATHTGGIDGMLSQVALVPEERLGVVVLTNTSPNSAFSPITYHILNRFLKLPERDWVALFQELDERTETRAETAREAQEAGRVPDTEPSLQLDGYAGYYEDPMYGEVRVTVEDDRLVLRRHEEWVGDLEHWHYDTFRVDWRHPAMGEGLVTFKLGFDGEVRLVDVQGVAEFQRRGESDG